MSQRVRRVGGRAGQYTLVLVVAFSINFFLPHLAPGDPVQYLHGGTAGGLTDAQVAELRGRYDLDQPLAAQYVDYWADLARGDLGTSVQRNQPVVDVLFGRLPWTVALLAPAIVLSATIAIFAGAAAARRRGSLGDVGLVTTLLALDAAPGFWIAMVLVAAFAVQLGWLPSFGAVPVSMAGGGLAWLAEVAKRLILPVTTITLATVGGTFLLARGAMLTALDEPYTLMAAAKGASERRVVYRHALRNALLPVYTNVSLGVAVMLSGAVVIETVFSYPGLGRLIYDATIARDYPLLRGAFVLVVVGVVAVNLLVDLTYPLLDPRVRGEDGLRP